MKAELEVTWESNEEIIKGYHDYFEMTFWSRVLISVKPISSAISHFLNSIIILQKSTNMITHSMNEMFFQCF